MQRQPNTRGLFAVEGVCQKNILDVLDRKVMVFRMKILSQFMMVLFLQTVGWADSNRPAPETKWTHSWSEGEDATSTFYYFMEVRGTVKKVRMMWNGGAQNRPTVTNYYLDSGVIRIVCLDAERKHLPELILGRDTGLEVLKEFKILKRSSAEMLVPPAPRKTLNKEERILLGNLISLLVEDRTLYVLKKRKEKE